VKKSATGDRDRQERMSNLKRRLKALEALHQPYSSGLIPPREDELSLINS
jgi:hypothetical protein